MLGVGVFFWFFFVFHWEHVLLETALQFSFQQGFRRAGNRLLSKLGKWL